MKNITLVLKGMAMGMAEVVPGVSGGTIAFITGIYEQLLASIKQVLGPEAWRTWRQSGFAAAWQQINGNFILFLLSGMAVGIIVGVFGVTYLLDNYPVPLWAFFFGLIVASAIYIGRQVGQWRVPEIAAVVIGTAVAYAITMASPTEGSTQLLMVFGAGALAISALILPGISGSFILLLLGMYTIIIPTLKNALSTLESDSLVIMAVFAFGCLLGLATFSRVLTWTFKHYRRPTLALLTGFMIGSLNKIWPWRQPVLGLTEEGETVTIAPGMIVDKVIKEANLLPSDYAAQVGEPFLVAAVMAIIAGLALVLVLERVGRPSETN